MGQPSVLIELFTDDIYIDYKTKPTDRQTYSMFDERTFNRCIDFLREMVQLEKRLRAHAQGIGYTKLMNELIGSEFVTKQILKGLAASRNRYYRLSRMYEEDLEELESEITNCERLIASYV